MPFGALAASSQRGVTAEPEREVRTSRGPPPTFSQTRNIWRPPGATWMRRTVGGPAVVAVRILGLPRRAVGPVAVAPAPASAHSTRRGQGHRRGPMAPDRANVAVPRQARPTYRPLGLFRGRVGRPRHSDGALRASRHESRVRGESVHPRSAGRPAPRTLERAVPGWAGPPNRGPPEHHSRLSWARHEGRGTGDRRGLDHYRAASRRQSAC
jgi:hypothetical protein